MCNKGFKALTQVLSILFVSSSVYTHYSDLVKIHGRPSPLKPLISLPFVQMCTACFFFSDKHWGTVWTGWAGGICRSVTQPWTDPQLCVWNVEPERCSVLPFLMVSSYTFRSWSQFWAWKSFIWMSSIHTNSVKIFLQFFFEIEDIYQWVSDFLTCRPPIVQHNNQRQPIG